MALADIIPLFPIDGRTVQLLPDEQKEVLRLETFEERKSCLQGMPDANSWKKSCPVCFRWKVTAEESGPWRLRVGMRQDLSDAEETIVTANADSEGVCETEFHRINLRIAEAYYWTVSAACGYWKWTDVDNGTGNSELWRVHSPIASFRTEDLAPRWIAIEGRVGNIRDLGGRRTLDGRRVRQGLVFRGEGLNDNSMDGVCVGRNRLMLADVDYMVNVLGIKTDLDLRTSFETAKMKTSPLGNCVRYVHHSSELYAGLFTPEGRAIMARNFRVFCKRENYPIYFHCIGGADRTGSLAYVLNGVLGVSRRELETDWESTFYPQLPDALQKSRGRSERHFIQGFEKYGDACATLRERISLYLNSCGITDGELKTFREIMLSEMTEGVR